MTDATSNSPLFATGKTLDSPVSDKSILNKFTEAALERHKREGLDLAIKARWVALAVIAVMLPFLNPRPEVLYYEALLLVLAAIGWAQRRAGVVGQSKAELGLLFLDLSVLAFILLFPNPFMETEVPTPVIYRFGNFMYFYVILAAGTLAYSWRTIMAIGHWTAVLWLTGLAAIWYFGYTDPALGDAFRSVFGGDPRIFQIFDPNSVNLDLRVQEIVVFLIASYTLALTVRRFNLLLLGNAELERERENLSRYFSPNVVAELSQKDQPLNETRTHDAAVLFVDIVGFTTFASGMPPGEVIELLRSFHKRMEQEVFRHGGTLDKYLGDGLMATFGTPTPTDQDAINALRCALSMRNALVEWNDKRSAAGLLQVQAGFGLHYGPVVLGDIGANRLEFAVIGNTVNVASRMEKLTRTLSAEIAISDHLRSVAGSQAAPGETVLNGLVRHPPQDIRGLSEPIVTWTLPRD